jgi:hypothetical protein
MIRKLIAGILLAAGLVSGGVACSSGNGSTQPASPPTAVQVAQQAGATHVQHITPTLYAYSEVNATLNGSPVDIATFRTPQLRDKWIAVAEEFTPVIRSGPLWAVAGLGVTRSQAGTGEPRRSVAHSVLQGVFQPMWPFAFAALVVLGVNYCIFGFVTWFCTIHRTFRDFVFWWGSDIWFPWRL